MAAAVAAGVAVLVALVLQTSVLPHLAWHGVAPDLVLVVVVAVALTRGAHTGTVVGFAAGVLVDLAPPADHVAGRWALALMLVGYVAGRVAEDRAARGTGVLGTLAVVAACSFLGSSVFALTGLLLGDAGTVDGIAGLLGVVATGVVLDVLVTPLVMPLVTRALERREPERLAVR
ncbi:MAG: rod shape-determining protein MreD [Nocardioides sp.]|nr:rod shape-determining protein MreD [Nocardioides sp.]